MFGKNLTAAMAILAFITCEPMAWGRLVIAVTTGQEHPERPAAVTAIQEYRILAQNATVASDDNEKSNSGSENRGSELESESAADEKDKSSNTKSKQLKPFVPSEKIPGEQAVDFPVDI
ncbi:MAG: hypothetical protein PVI13_09330 [Desulfobacterales bacterium]|jgi:hypothetical protein